MSRHNMDVSHWVEVSGYRMPQRYAGHPALEFCNTWAGWGEPPRPEREWLKDYDRFAVWAGYVELLDPTEVARLRREAREASLTASRVLERARELREALYQVFIEPDDAAAFRLVAETARRAMASAELVDEPSGPGRRERTARWRLPALLGLEQPLLAVARAGAYLLCSPDRSRVRSCPGEDCGWLFIDRHGRRRWCSMNTCGNRAKVRAHAERQRQNS